ATTLAITNSVAFDAFSSLITLGDDPADTTNFGSLTFTGGAVTITEDSATILASSNSASSLALTSAGSITDAAARTDAGPDRAAGSITDAAATTLAVTNNATFGAGSSAITLGDDAGDTTNFGSLTFTGGAVTITEDSASVLAGSNSATSLALTSAGSITDAAA